MIEAEVNVHRRVPVDRPSDDRIRRVIVHALSQEGANGEWTVSVVFVDDTEMQRMHRDFMAIDEPTDIMTFPSDPEFDGTTGGDLVISVETAASQAGEHGSTTEEELEFLIVHGVLHLLGWNDETLADRAAMLDRQSEILRTLG